MMGAMQMRAGFVAGVGRMECDEFDVRPPNDGEILVHSTYGSICGSDLHLVAMGVGLPEPPCPPGFPGHEGVGVVVESKHPDWAEGDRVLTVPNAFVGSCFAEYQTLDPRYVARLPEAEVPDSHLLMAQQLGTVVFGLRQRPVDVCGKTVAVIGQGSAGLFFTYLLKRAGARVIASDLSPARRAVSEHYGADVVVDGADPDLLRDAVRDATMVGADYVVEAVGSNPTLNLAVDVVRGDGDVLWFGLPDSADEVPFSFNTFFRKRLTVNTVWGAQDEPGLASFRHALDLIATGQIDVSPLLSHVLPIEQIGTALDLAHSRDDGALKVSVSF